MSQTKLIQHFTKVTGVAPADIRYSEYADELAEWSVAYHDVNIVNALYVQHYKSPRNMRVVQNKTTNLWILSKYNHDVI